MSGLLAAWAFFATITILSMIAGMCRAPMLPWLPIVVLIAAIVAAITYNITKE